MSLLELKLKYFCEVKDGTHDTPQYVNVSDNTFPLVTPKDITNGILSFDNAKHISYEDYLAINKRSNVEKYDVIMPMIGTVGNPAIVMTNEPFSIKNVALFKTSPDLLKAKYLKYMLDSSYIKEQFNLNSRGGVQSFVSLTVLENLNILMPKDLKSVISYLDDKTKKVDALIDSKAKLLNLLEQQRHSIITEAVTKGLNPNVKMKNSGVEWIGEIPEHWEVTKIKYTTYVKGRIGWQGLKSDEFIDEGPFLVTGTDFLQGYVNWDTCYHISEKRYNEAPPIQLQENDLLITKDGTIGKLAIVKEMPYKAILNSGVFVTRPFHNKYLSKYMYWLLSSAIFDKYIKFMETGSTIKHLYQETFVNFSYPIPSTVEQTEILNYLDIKIGEIDSIKSNLVKQIEKLKEYRQALIYEAVTGKIDVRDMELDEVR
ncbi:restriction endonuclease subunit S [Bacillus safensis]|uniref:restriction endonuclease subunit S n=1 Tax=Bacillus safensis TaxID=561879 RepID=UPI0024819FF3|nr:restriction endonuclease subunit S [Bacillus safensis]MDI0273810.1 restriction endonuclease subunit S [Bacillus safensis]